MGAESIRKTTFERLTEGSIRIRSGSEQQRDSRAEEHKKQKNNEVLKKICNCPVRFGRLSPGEVIQSKSKGWAQIEI
jgi:hypothetical protein